MILIGFAFLAGIVTIASPCILPLLPIVLSGSTGAGKLRPFGIVTGFVLVFTLATLGLSALVRATGVSPNVTRWIAVVVLALFGIVMLVPKLTILMESFASRLATAGSRAQMATREATGFGPGLVVGATLGLVWTPCVGPIMASVITLAATGAVGGVAVAVTVAYALGTGLPMLGIIIGGRALVGRLSGLKKAGGAIQRVFATLMILVAAAIAFNLDRDFQVWVLDTFPALERGITAIERNDLVEEELDRLRVE